MKWAQDKLKSLGKSVQYKIIPECGKLMTSLRPDFVILDNIENINPHYAWFFVELQTNDKIDDEHKGKIVKYNTMILEANVRRKYIVSVVGNLNIMHLVKTERTNEGFLHQLTDEIDFWNKGMSYILQMLDDPSHAGYTSQEIFHVKINK